MSESKELGDRCRQSRDAKFRTGWQRIVVGGKAAVPVRVHCLSPIPEVPATWWSMSRVPPGELLGFCIGQF